MRKIQQREWLTLSRIFGMSDRTLSNYRVLILELCLIKCYCTVMNLRIKKQWVLKEFLVPLSLKKITLSREQITVMTTVASEKSSPVPNLEFVFKVVGKCISCISSPGRQKSYRLEHILKFIEKVSARSYALLPPI